jgi:hypothetical protein
LQWNTIVLGKSWFIFWLENWRRIFDQIGITSLF